MSFPTGSGVVITSVSSDPEGGGGGGGGGCGITDSFARTIPANQVTGGNSDWGTQWEVTNWLDAGDTVAVAPGVMTVAVANRLEMTLANMPSAHTWYARWRMRWSTASTSTRVMITFGNVFLRLFQSFESPSTANVVLEAAGTDQETAVFPFSVGEWYECELADYYSAEEEEPNPPSAPDGYRAVVFRINGSIVAIDVGEYLHTPSDDFILEVRRFDDGSDAVSFSEFDVRDAQLCSGLTEILVDDFNDRGLAYDASEDSSFIGSTPGGPGWIVLYTSPQDPVEAWIAGDVDERWVAFQLPSTDSLPDSVRLRAYAPDYSSLGALLYGNLDVSCRVWFGPLQEITPGRTASGGLSIDCGPSSIIKGYGDIPFYWQFSANLGWRYDVTEDVNYSFISVEGPGGEAQLPPSPFAANSAGIPLSTWGTFRYENRPDEGYARASFTPDGGSPISVQVSIPPYASRPSKLDFLWSYGSDAQGTGGPGWDVAFDDFRLSTGGAPGTGVPGESTPAVVIVGSGNVG